MTIYSVTMTDHFDAAGTDGGNAFIELAVTKKVISYVPTKARPRPIEPSILTMRIDFENDDQPGKLTCKADPGGNNTHLEFAMRIWLRIADMMELTECEQYSAMFPSHKSEQFHHKLQVEL